MALTDRDLADLGMSRGPAKPAGLIGDKNSPAARDSLYKAIRKLPSNVMRSLNGQPVEVPGDAPSEGPSALGRLLMSLTGRK